MRNRARSCDAVAEITLAHCPKTVSIVTHLGLWHVLRTPCAIGIVVPRERKACSKEEATNRHAQLTSNVDVEGSSWLVAIGVI